MKRLKIKYHDVIREYVKDEIRKREEERQRIKESIEAKEKEREMALLKKLKEKYGVE